MIKLKDTHKSLLILLVVVFSFAFITKVIATMSPYAPGATRNPGCGPTDPNCTVDIKSNLYKENAASAVTNVTTGIDAVTIGKNNTASGKSAIALGQGDGIESFGASATGDYSIALGSNSLASGDSSMAIGGSSRGKNSVAIGVGTNAYSYGEISLGSTPTSYTPGSAISWVATDRIFNVGNGNGIGSDAFTILKNGKIGIGNAEPAYILDINSTGAIRLPHGNTSERPTAQKGLFRFNQENNTLEYVNKENVWQSLTLGGGSTYNLYTEGATSTGYTSPSATAINAIAIGQGSTANSFSQITLGTYSEPIMGTSSTGFEPNDPILIVGNGASIDEKSNALVISKNGNIGIGMNAGVSKNAMDFLSGAHVTASGMFVDASDQALKENVEDLPYGLREVNEMQPRSFDYIIDGSHSIGFVAQEMENVIPEVVSGSDGHKGISYGQLTAVLVNAVQELSERVAQLEASQGVTYTTTTTNTTPPQDSSGEENDNSSTTSSTPPGDGNGSSTEGEVQGASIIRTTNDMNLTNALLFAGLALLLANLIIMLKKPFPSKK